MAMLDAPVQHVLSVILSKQKSDDEIVIVFFNSGDFNSCQT